MHEVEQLLTQIEQGDAQAAEKLLPLVYRELRQLAARRLSQERAGQTLDATALVHEAYLRLAGGTRPRAWQGSSHFFAAAAEAMRRILIEKARSRNTLKRGRGMGRVDLDAAPALSDGPATVDLLALDETLERLAAESPLRAQLVKLRFFAGLTMREAAAALDISLASAERHWTYARSWLYAELHDAERSPAVAEPKQRAEASDNEA